MFLGSKEESDWISKGQFAHFFPDVWEAYLERTPKEYKLNPTAYHLDMIFNGNEEDKKRSAYAYACLNMGVMRLDDRYNTENYDEFIPSGMWIEMHYASNGYFMPDNYILNNTGKLTMPIYIVQGRYDMLCPPGVAYKLSKGLANCQIYWTTSNHSTEHEDYNVFKSILANL